MKRTLIIFCMAAALSLSSFNVRAQSLKDILGNLAGSVASGDSTSSSNPLGKLGSILGNVVANDKFTIDDLVGKWDYVSPAVSFQSDNALKKIGGAGAATAVEDKLAPYYKTLGLTRTSLTVDAEHNFTMKLGVAQLKGTIEKDDESGDLIFAFNAFGKVSLGKVSAHATKAGSTLNLTFDATRLVQILTKVAGVLNNATLKAVTDLVNSYDGIYMGFKLKESVTKL